MSKLWETLGHKSGQCKSKTVQKDKEIICNYCKKSGHHKSQCFKLLRKNQNQAEGNQGGTRNGIAGSADVVLTTMTANDGIDSKIWIGDSGASCPYCNSEEGLYDYTTISEEITVGNGSKMLAKKVESLRGSTEKWRKICRRTQGRKICTRGMGTSF
jgi:hypothetical protein